MPVLVALDYNEVGAAITPDAAMPTAILRHLDLYRYPVNFLL